MDLPYPYYAIKDSEDKPVFEEELRCEVKPGHVLFGFSVRAIGRRYDQEDVLFELTDGSGRVATVHLTWAGEEEQPPWPGAVIFSNFAEWMQSVKDEYGEPEEKRG